MSGSEVQSTAVLREESRNDLDFVALGSDFVIPVHQHSSIRKHETNVHHRVFDANAFVGATSEYKVVLRIHVRAAFGIEPSLGKE